MYTRCPKCDAVYAVEARELRSGRGEVLCGRCHILFSALAALADSPDHAYADPYAALTVPTLGDAAHAAASEPIISLRAEPRHPLPAESLYHSEDETSGRFAEFEIAPPPVDAGGATPVWGMAALAALLLLFIQAMVFEGSNLAQQPRLRPWMARLCPLFDCKVPEFRDLPRLAVVERSLTPAQGGVDGLEFRAVLANYAEQAQPYPRLKLTLSQYNGEPMAQRVFTPEIYLPDAANHPALAAGGAAEIHLTIANPGKDVGGFALELL